MVSSGESSSESESTLHVGIIGHYYYTVYVRAATTTLYVITSCVICKTILISIKANIIVLSRTTGA